MVPQSPPRIIRDTGGLPTNPNPAPKVGRRPKAAEGSKRRQQGPVLDPQAPKQTHVPNVDTTSPPRDQTRPPAPYQSSSKLKSPPMIRRNKGAPLKFTAAALTPPASLRAPVNIGGHFKQSQNAAIRTWWNSNGQINPVKGRKFWWWFKSESPYGQGSTKYYVRPTTARWKGEWREFKPPY